MKRVLFEFECAYCGDTEHLTADKADKRGWEDVTNKNKEVVQRCPVCGYKAAKSKPEYVKKIIAKGGTVLELAEATGEYLAKIERMLGIR